MSRPLKFYEREAIHAAWSSAHASVRRRQHPYVEALRAEYGRGEVVFVDGTLTLAREVLDMAVHLENHPYSQLASRLWSVPGLAGVLPPLRDLDVDPSPFEREGYFHLVATLASTLATGGAYTLLSHERARPLALATSFADEVLRDDGVAFVSHAAWCSFFRDVAWDFTMLALSPSSSRVSLLLATDTD